MLLPISLVFVALAAAYMVLTVRSGDSRLVCYDVLPTSWAWSGVFLALMVGMAAYSATGLVTADVVPWVLLHVALLAGVVASLWRAPVRESLGELKLSWLVELLMLVVGAYLTFVAIEMPSNPNLTSFNLAGMLVEIVVVFLVLLVGHLVFLRTGAGAPVGALVLFVCGVAEYFVVLFKDSPIMASDILAIGTAATVSGDYTYIANSMLIGGLALAVATILMLSLTPHVELGDAKRSVVTALIGLALGGGTFFAATHLNFTEMYGIVVGGWQPLNSYYRQGFLTAFLTSVQDLKPKKPKGYSNEKAEETQAAYAAEYDAGAGSSEARTAATAQFEEIQPTVIVVMNETFADMSIYENLHAGYEGPQWLNSFEDYLMKGTLYVSPYGGGTCNSEWEILTGCSMAYFGIGVYPYMVYDWSGVENMASQFHDLGYHTTAMHPNHATNWNRDVVYEDLGFDQFLDITDFYGSERLRGKVSDAATYDRILQMLEEDESPQFILDVTMQNHSSYDTGLLPEDMVTHYDVDGVNDPELDEYLALIDESDRALGEFVEQLSELDRPVVLIFFGDHQAKIAAAYNNQIFSEEAEGPVHEQRTHEVPYLVYANYDVAGYEQPGGLNMTSTNYLGTQVMEAIGAPLSEYQRAQLQIRLDMPAINMMGYMSRDGVWYEAGDKKGSNYDAYVDLWALQYRRLFGDGVHYQTGAGAAGIL